MMVQDYPSSAAAKDFLARVLEMGWGMSPDIEADFQRELVEIEAESMGWQPLEPGA